jgi:hypothetical protein
MRSVAWHLTLGLFCILGLLIGINAHQTLQWTTTSRAESNAVQIRPQEQTYHLKTSASVYSIFEDHSQQTFHDVALKVRP